MCVRPWRFRPGPGSKLTSAGALHVPSPLGAGVCVGEAEESMRVSLSSREQRGPSVWRVS